MKQQRHFCSLFWDFCPNFCSLLQAREGKEAVLVLENTSVFSSSVPTVIPQPSAPCPEVQKQKDTIQEVLRDFASAELVWECSAPTPT